MCLCNTTVTHYIVIIETLIMNIQQIKFWRKTLDSDSGEYPQISNQDLDVVDFLDRNPQLLRLTSPFCEEGYKTMYL